MATGTIETAKATNPLKDLLKYGQSVWFDYIRRDLLTSGELKRLIDEDGLRGMTSNPSIFEKAIADSTLYSDILQSLRPRTDLDAKGRYEILAIRDIQEATDSFARCIKTRNVATVTSASKSRPISLAIPRALWPRHADSGRPSAARI